jgi:hypothetical protein
MNISEKLWSRSIPEPNSGCWIWMGATSFDYGIIYDGKTRWKTHRLAFSLSHGAIPQGMHVCHRCDIPSCINPDHLFLGTPADNTADKMKKGRWGGPKKFYGEKHWQAKLTNESVSAIRVRYSLGYSQRELAEKFNVAKSTIWAIVNHTTWRN